MITIFAIPKPLNGPVAVTQRNAIKSWTQLKPGCEVILFGNDPGVADIAKELGLAHVPDVARNELGTPLLSDIFEKARAMASNDIVCFINADIILKSDFLDAVRRVKDRRDNFLLVGRRWDIDIDRPLEFDAGWEEKLTAEVRKNGVRHEATGIDYFVFRKGMWGSIPPFLIGRPGYDNWLIYRARMLNIPVINCSKVVMAIHQNHNYGHIKDINNRMGDGPEALYNRSLMGGYENAYTLDDTDWALTRHFLLPTPYNTRLPKNVRHFVRKYTG